MEGSLCHSFYPCSYACGVVQPNQGEAIPGSRNLFSGSWPIQETLDELISLLPGLKVTGEYHHSLTLRLSISVWVVGSVVLKIDGHLWPREDTARNIRELPRSQEEAQVNFWKGTGVSNSCHVNAKTGTVERTQIVPGKANVRKASDDMKPPPSHISNCLPSWMKKGGLRPPHVQHSVNYHSHTKTNK